MAKLSARGRTELLRMEKTYPSEVGNMRATITLMSDGVALIKKTFISPEGKVGHSGGWKVHGRLKKGSTVEDIKASLEKNGYQQVKGRR